MKSFLRFVLICAFTAGSLPTFAQLNGTYTIGGTSPDYLTFTDAVNAMVNSGLTGGVVFNVRAGTYTEQLNIPEIGGVNSNDSIVFQSENGIQSSVILRFGASSSLDNWVLDIDGTDWITFKDMTMKSFGGFNYGTIMKIGNEARHVNFQNVLFNGKTGTVSTSTDKVMIDGMNSLVDSNIVFNSCTFLNGVFAIRYQHAIHLHVVGCTFTNTASSGVDVYLEKNESLLFGGNIESSGGPDIYYSYGSNDNIIANNFIFGTINLSYSDGTLDHETKVLNNMVLGSISVKSSRWADIFNNTVYNPSGASLTVSTYGGSGNSSNVQIANNILVSGLDVALNLEDLIYLSYLDYNWYYSGGPNILSLNGFNYADLSTWQTSTSKSAHAVNEPVHFQGPPDLHICRDQTLHTGDPMVAIPFDIDFDVRNLAAPAIGADEYDPWFVTPNPAVVCAGSALQINVNNSKSGDLFTWSGGDLSSPVNGSSLTVNPSSDQDYILTWIGTLCTSTDTVHVTAEASPIPSLNVNNNTMTSSVTGTSYVWYFNGSPISGATSQSYTATQNGDYYVIVTNASGCEGQSNTVTINSVGILNPVLPIISLNIAPNPSEGLFHLSSNASVQGKTSIEVLNVLGQSIYQNTISTTGIALDQWIDLRNESDGLYLLAVTTNEQRIVVRIVKK